MSSPPSSGTMNPKPRSMLKLLTVPITLPGGGGGSPGIGPRLGGGAPYGPPGVTTIPEAAPAAPRGGGRLGSV
eukprot:1445301-Prymnesium_polylepis.1